MTRKFNSKGTSFAKNKKQSQKPLKTKKPFSSINPRRRVQPMDELPVDLGKELERRMDTRTNALLMGMDGGVGRGVDSGSDLNSLTPGDTLENDYESITNTNPLTENAYIHGVFQENSVFKEDEVTSLQHQHKHRTVSNRLETDRIEELPARPREEVSFTPPSPKTKRSPKTLEPSD